MTCARKEAAHRAPSQAIDQAVDQSLGPYLPVGLGQSRLGEGKRLGDKSRKRHEVHAKPHVEGLDPILHEGQEMLRLARGGAQARLDHRRGTVGAGDPKRNAPAASFGAGELPAQQMRETVEAGQDAVMGDERLGEGKPRREIGQRQKRDARLLAPPQRLIEAKQDGLGHLLGMKPPFETGARQIVELADALQPKPAQEAGDLRRKTQGLDREGRKRGPNLAIANDEGGFGREAGQRMRPAQGLGKSKPRGEPCARKPSLPNRPEARSRRRRDGARR